MKEAARVMTYALLVAVVAGMRLGPGTTPTKYYWSGKNGDSLRTGSSPFTLPSGLSGGPTWSFHEEPPYDPHTKAIYPEYKGLIRAAPLIDDKKNIYLSTISSGNIYKFTPDGQIIWKHHSGGAIPDIPSLLDGRLFASSSGSPKDEVFALDMETGEKVWSTPVGREISGDTWSMAAGDGIVIAAAQGLIPIGMNQALVALHASNGSVAWRFKSNSPLYNILVSIKDGSCVFSTSDGRVYRLDLQTGRVIWNTAHPAASLLSGGFSTGGTVIGPNGVIYVTWNEKATTPPSDGQDTSMFGAQVGKVAAYRFSDGERLWTYDTGSYEANNGAAVGRLGPSGKLGVAIGIGGNPNSPDAAKGISSGSTPSSGPEHRGRIIMIDAETAKLLWSYDVPNWYGAGLGDDKRPDICLPDAFGNAAIGGDGTVYVGFQNGKFYGVGDKNGDGIISESEVDTWQAGACFQGSPAIAPGMLVATPCNGMHVWNF